MPTGQLPLIWIEYKLDDRHGWNGCQVVGVKHSEQRLCDLRKLVVDLVMDARRQEGERLDQAFDMGILRFVCFEQ